MKKLLVLFIFIFSSNALAQPVTTKVPTTLQTSQCSTTQLLLGAGTGVSPICATLGTNLSLSGTTLNATGGGGSISLTTTGTSGASSLTGSVLNVPQYQGALTLTTTGTSGAATLSGTTLNVPQYTGGGGGGTATTKQDFFAASSDFVPGTTTTLTLTTAPPSSPQLLVYFDGVNQTSNTWHLSGATITFNSAIPSNVQAVETISGLTGGGGGGTATYVSSTVPFGSAITPTSNTSTDITSVSLTSGVWTCFGSIAWSGATGTITVNNENGWISQTSATYPTLSTALHHLASPGYISSTTSEFPTGVLYLSLSSTTTVYLSTNMSWSGGGTLSAWGSIGCISH